MSLLDPILWIIPSYVANSAATLSRYIKKVHPVDMGLRFGDKRLFGDGKTWEGFFIGLILGTASWVVVVPFLPGYTLTNSFLLSLGAMVGDLLGSFVKRRVGMKRGEEAPLLDQLDFIFGSFLFLPPNPYWASVIVVITPLVHRIANIIGYLVGVKREPW